MYKDGYLTHKRGKKTTKIYLSAQPETALKEFISFLQEKDQIYSIKDKEKEEEDILGEQVVIKEIADWTQLKKKKKQLDVILSQFILETTRHYGLESKKNKDQLTTLINIANLQGYLNDKTVVLKENKIVDIIGLEVKEGKFYLPTSNKKIRPVKSTSRRTEVSSRTKLGVNFYALWVDFLKFYSTGAR